MECKKQWATHIYNREREREREIQPHKATTFSSEGGQERDREILCKKPSSKLNQI
jgi:hypothetical protein